MKLGKIAGVALLALLPAYAEAQSLKTEIMIAPKAEESHMIRISGSSNLKGLNASGFVDFFEKGTDNFYSELWMKHNIRGKFGLQGELNNGRYTLDKGERKNAPAVLRGGVIADVPVPKNCYMSLKLLPLTATSEGVQKSHQVGIYGEAKLPKGFYIENWTDYNFGANEKPSTLTEFTAGKQIRDNLSLQVQLPYNVNSPGWALRAGARYKIK